MNIPGRLDSRLAEKPASVEAGLADKFYRIQHFYKILTKRKTLTTLKFNRVQEGIVSEFERQIKAHGVIRHFDLKTRQQGVSTLCLIWWLDDTIFNVGTQTGILAHKNESLGYLMEIIRRAHKSMPDDWRVPVEGDNKHELKFKYIDSKIFSSLSIRSTGLHNLHVSEWCLCDDLEIQATLGACSPMTNVTGESTGHGVGNHGYTTYQDAKLGNAEDKMTAFFFPWFIQEEYTRDPGEQIIKPTPEEKRTIMVAKTEWGVDITPGQLLWRRDTKRKLKGIFRQEYPETDDDAFLTSGNKFFNFKKLHRLILESKEWEISHPPVEETDDYIRWEDYDKHCIYVAGADTSEGAKDSSCLKIMNVTKRREAFRYRARVAPKTFYKVCDKWGRFFGTCLLAIERNLHGHAVLLGLEENCRYPNLFKELKGTRIRDIVHVGKKTRAMSEHKLGWETDSVSRPLMLDYLKVAIEGDEEDDEDHFEPEFTIFDQQLLSECLTFEEIDGKFQAIEGETDDNVIATAICFQMFLRQAKEVHRGGSFPAVITLGQREST